ncbi:class I SAM-dependent RNA methyltransferase [Sphingomonas sp.]|uniref:class I SAM-dependent RNA methyltransferase n=1 Tax=Sphingomonas sp. TaxID=28214 RepID=UPI0025F77528|nr:class I SAM-dependent RNA methyltransferase [Sphingomonas sp.]
MSIIVRIAARGEGVTADGQHAPFAVPGDVVGAGGTIVAGPHHQAPPCRHFPHCGGCQLQHADDATYADYLRDRITHALQTQGLAIPEMRAVHLSPPRARRRATFQAERRGRSVIIGFNEASSHRIVDLRECHVVLPELFALVAPLRTLLGKIMADKARAKVSMTRADQGVDLLIEGVTVEGLEAVEALTDFGRARKLARLSIDEGYGPSPRYIPGDVTITLGGVPVGLPDGAFLQATADGEAALVAAVREIIGPATVTADLFSGLGTFALSLSGAVHAVEGARDAILALAATRRVTVEHRDLFRRPLDVSELARFEAVVLDPPRAGAREQVVSLATSAVPHIAYVSCNPSSFARDAAVLIAGGYELEWILPVGQFRWSTHVELAASFRR